MSKSGLKTKILNKQIINNKNFITHFWEVLLSTIHYTIILLTVKNINVKFYIKISKTQKTVVGTIYEEGGINLLLYCLTKNMFKRFHKNYLMFLLIKIDKLLHFQHSLRPGDNFTMCKHNITRSKPYLFHDKFD